MKADLDTTRLLAAEATLDRLSKDISSLFEQLGQGSFLLSGAPGRIDDGRHHNESDALWTEIATLRLGLERLRHENTILWARVLRPKREAKEAVLSERHAGRLELALKTLESEGVEAALRLVDTLMARAGTRSITAILRGVAQQILAKGDAKMALSVGERAQTIFPELETAHLIWRAASLVNDHQARIRISEYILKSSSIRSISGRELDQNWKDLGKASLYLNGIGRLQSGVPYPVPIYGKVLMALHSSLPMTRAGYTYRSHALLKELRDFGCSVRPYTRLGYPADLRMLASKEPESGFKAEYVVDGVRYRRLPGDVAALGRAGAPLDRYLANYAHALQMAIRRERLHIVHTASNFVNAVAGCMAAQDARRPFIHEVRGFWELTGASRNPGDEVELHRIAEGKLEAEAASRADRVITLNGPMKEELVNRGVAADRIAIVPNGVAPEELSPMAKDLELGQRLGLSDAPTIGYVGSFSSYEGLEDLILAFRLLKERGIVFNGLLVGDGEVFRTLETMVQELDLAGQVRLTGRVEHSQVRAFYSLIDIAPFPRKPMRVCELVSPIKPYEAMGMAKAVVVSSVAALAEMVENGVTGFTFEKGSVVDLADRLELLIRNGELRSQVGEQSRRWVLEHRTWERSAAVIRELYREVSAEWAARRILEDA